MRFYIEYTSCSFLTTSAFSVSRRGEYSGAFRGRATFLAGFKWRERVTGAHDKFQCSRLYLATLSIPGVTVTTRENSSI